MMRTLDFSHNVIGVIKHLTLQVLYGVLIPSEYGNGIIPVNFMIPLVYLSFPIGI